jgi:signal transduction histidine kinase
MHDGMAQVLGYVNTKAQAVKELLKSGRMESAAEHMEQLETAAQETYDDVREAILALGIDSRNRPFLDIVREYIDRFDELSGVPAEFLLEGEPHSFNPSTEVQLLRIIQEALANVRKHSKASRVQVTMSFNGGACGLTVEDDGVGFDRDGEARGPGPHLGLQSMQERATSIGARFELDTNQGNGTRIVLEIPEEDA